jgi:hypothetical protein
LTHEDEIRARGGRGAIGNTPATGIDTPLPHPSAAGATPGDWNTSRRSRSPSSFSRQSSPERDDGMSVGSRNHVVGANKALKIRRLVGNILAFLTDLVALLMISYCRSMGNGKQKWFEILQLSMHTSDKED